MLNRLLLAAIITLVCANGARSQDGMSATEVALLLRLDVPSSQVLATVKRLGGPLKISDAGLVEIRKLGGSQDLLNALALHAETRRHRVRLAREFMVHRIGGTPFNLLIPERPRPWILQRQESGRGIMVTLRPPDHQGRDWLAAPGIFVLIQKSTPFPRESEPLVAERLTGTIARRLLGWGARMRSQTTATGRIGRREVPEHRISIGDPRRKFRGDLVTRMRILRDGTILIVGFGCGSSDRESVEALFHVVAESLDVPGEDL